MINEDMKRKQLMIDGMRIPIYIMQIRSPGIVIYEGSHPSFVDGDRNSHGVIPASHVITIAIEYAINYYFATEIASIRAVFACLPAVLFTFCTEISQIVLLLLVYYFPHFTINTYFKFIFSLGRRCFISLFNYFSNCY